jgi:glutamate synthase domain-containing protein 1
MYEGGEHSPVMSKVEDYLNSKTNISQSEQIPVYPNDLISQGPYFKRYFLDPIRELLSPDQTEEDYIVDTVMNINKTEGAFVVSSGKNMGVFKGVGFPEDIADYFRIEDYQGYMWVAHNRFPTNTPGWWGGAHPFTILDKAVVHNGEITSYGTNVRWLEMYGYYCLLQTDTEVISYIYDKLTRNEGININGDKVINL